jgi:hypothetical protein
MTTSNPIAELMNLVPPPRQPLANQGDWASLGTVLPAVFCQRGAFMPLPPS